MKKFLGPLLLVGMFVIAGIVAILQNDTAIELETENVALRAISPSVISSGSLRFKDQVELSPEVIGKVLNVYVKEGDFVSPGQVLLKIDDSTLRAEIAQQNAVVRASRFNLEQSRTRALLAKRQLVRFEALAARGFATRSGLEERQAEFEDARLAVDANAQRLRQVEASLEGVRTQIGKTVVRAPSSGTVIVVNIKVGETAVPSSVGIPGSNLITIANTKSLIAEINVGEADIASIKVGQKSSITVSAYPDQSFAGSLQQISISPAQDKVTSARVGNEAKTYTVEVSLTDVEGFLLRPGMSVRAEIFAEAIGKVPSVPIQAIQYEKPERDEKVKSSRRADDKRKAYIILVNGGRAVRRNVMLGVSDDSHIEIVSGVEVGKKVAIGPYRELQFVVANDRVIELADGDK